MEAETRGLKEITIGNDFLNPIQERWQEDHGMNVHDGFILDDL
jgi:hypothetical protein